MKYRILILITIIISLGQNVYRMLQTRHACTHARAHTRAHARIQARAHTRAHAHTCTHTAVATVTARRTGYRYSVSPNRDGPLRLRQCRLLAIQITTCTGDPITPIFWMFFVYKKMLDRTEMRSRDRICFQPIRTVSDISREDRARIVNCERRQTDRFNENYSIDTANMLC